MFDWIFGLMCAILCSAVGLVVGLGVWGLTAGRPDPVGARSAKTERNPYHEMYEEVVDHVSEKGTRNER